MSKFRSIQLCSIHLIVALLATLGTSPLVHGQQATAESEPQQSEGRLDMGAMLVEGLKATEGCLGVQTCRWSDGKNSIVAWFANKQAAVDWYHSDVHQAMMSGQTDSSLGDDEALEYVEDEEMPIMVIATLTPSTKPELPGINLPISQISIEMFTPLPGGAQVGGRVSPAAFHVPHMRDYTPDNDAEAEADRGKDSDK